MREWRLLDPQPAPPQEEVEVEVEMEAEAEDEPAAAGGRRRSNRAAAANIERAKKAARTLRGVPRAELPGQRIVVTYTDEEALAAGESRPTGGAALVGCYIEVHWPLDKVWYRAQVTRYVEKKDSHELVYLSDAVKEVLDLKKEGWRHVVKLVKTAYRGTLIRASAEEGLLVHFDGGAGGFTIGDEEAECWVDEDGEDEWCWEANFRPPKGVHVMPALEPAVEPMYFVAAAGSTGTASMLQHWVPLAELRPHWLWRGADDGWVSGAKAKVSGVRMAAGAATARRRTTTRTTRTKWRRRRKRRSGRRRGRDQGRGRGRGGGGGGGGRW